MDQPSFATGTRPTPARPAPGWVRVVRRVGRWAALLGAVVSAGIMFGVVADVATRQISGRSIPGMLELVETFMVIVVYLSLAHAAAVGAHVRMTLLSHYLPDHWSRLVRLFGVTVAMLGSAWLCWATTTRALTAIEAGEVRQGLLRFPVWPARIAVAVGFALLTVEYAARIWEEWQSRPALPVRQQVTSMVADPGDA